MKKVFAVVLCLALTLTMFAACARGGAPTTPSNTTPSGTQTPSGGDTAPATTYSVRVGHVLATAHPYTSGLEKYKEILEKNTNGQIKVDVFANSQLGNERDMVEGLQLGTLEMTLVSTAPLASFTDDFLVFDLPFIFTTTAQARGCVDSEIGQGMLNGLDEQGIKGLVYFENGFRNVTNSDHSIVKPEDLKGMKIRTMENQIHMDSFKAMGADPTPMAFGELFTALQQKTIDGQENPLAIVDTSKFYEVQKYLSLTEHFYAAAPLLMAKTYYDSLSSDLQASVLDAAKQARDYERGLLDDMNSKLIDQLKNKNGMIVNEVDKAPFVEAVQSVYEKYKGTGKGQIPAELIEKVQNYK